MIDPPGLISWEARVSGLVSLSFAKVSSVYTDGSTYNVTPFSIAKSRMRSQRKRFVIAVIDKWSPLPLTVRTVLVVDLVIGWSGNRQQVTRCRFTVNCSDYG